MITRVRVKNFKSLADVDVSLGPLTVLVGRNGAGKSAFLDALKFVRDALRRDLDFAVEQRGNFSLLQRQAGGTAESPDVSFALSVVAQDFQAEYAFTLGSSGSGGAVLKSETCRMNRAGQPAHRDYALENGKWVTAPQSPFSFDPNVRYPELKVEPNQLVLSHLNGGDREFTLLHHLLTGSFFYSILPETFRKPQSSPRDYPLEENGSNLAAALQRLQKTEWYPDLLIALRHVTGDVTGIDINATGSYLFTTLRHTQENGWETGFLLEQESEGTLHALGILTAIYQEGHHVLTAIEEPETALYPNLFCLFSDILKEASLRQQVLITTQSPDMISYFGANQLRIAEKENGLTQIGILEDRQREAIHREMFSAGDLLRVEGLHSEPASDARVSDA